MLANTITLETAGKIQTRQIPRLAFSAATLECANSWRKIVSAAYSDIVDAHISGSCCYQCRQRTGTLRLGQLPVHRIPRSPLELSTNVFVIFLFTNVDRSGRGAFLVRRRHCNATPNKLITINQQTKKYQSHFTVYSGPLQPHIWNNSEKQIIISF